ncbi:MAG: class I SAM-dependent methyltransferase [Alphaproteobacteria bacterium]
MTPSHQGVIENEDQTKINMDNMYRWTRHVYDLSRKYYLLGRDQMIDRLNIKPGERVCEVGCGTARNLIKIAKRYPGGVYFGLDASDEMLKTAQKNLQPSDLQGEIRLEQAYSQSFDPASLFDLSEPLDKIVFSYALSIIPPWAESVDHALDMLPSGGEIHIVDFGGQEELPEFFRRFLFWWLKKFHVYYKPDILSYLKRLDYEKKGVLELQSLYKGYAYRAVFTKA